ncbi:MBL fold metallo-hydrolase [Aurantiacibacter gangjinensis]|uniref:beta-lactamase n=1 Tax=Aurantiacibacter gangjinensis TaxID=502682 RepID=A0A0G9MQ99_9SPHN|nr:MBL fold metallo-hydrolase [Aurantiacibacter gangjinensis]APE28757.1 Cyclase [Aurantiacibacter gangjinensis]KLE32912.1 Zn-dependent hydrolase [Aurantiacibacter gangjinensis]
MKLPIACFALLASTAMSLAAQDMADVEITAEEVAPGIAVLFGRGGNIGVSHGEDGTILIDDQYAPLTGRIQQAVSDLGATPVRFLINTHYHGDHIGGNENFGHAGALIMAHDNVRERLITGTGRTPAAAPAGLPVITYDTGMTIHANGDTVDIIYLDGHTDGDSIVVWREDNVIHMGDLFFHEFGFPFVDVEAGGNVRHLLASLGTAIGMMDDETVVIPGHGPVATRSDLVNYRVMISESVAAVEAMLAEGMDRDAIVEANPVGPLRNTDGFISDEAFIDAIIASL